MNANETTYGSQLLDSTVMDDVMAGCAPDLTPPFEPWNPYGVYPFPYPYVQPGQITFGGFATEDSVKELRKEVEELKKLLNAVLNNDKQEKIEAVRKMASLVGIEISECLPTVSVPSLWSTENFVQPDSVLTATSSDGEHMKIRGETAWSDNVDWDKA